ncbi:hypothetical protein C8J57DRAFT_1234872 [Mycena rebaudengoi]|nr:hypothetical protein C8J57DRAFT_1234872 [Mycena rebaudengoi]
MPNATELTASKIAAQLGLTATGFTLVPSTIYRNARETRILMVLLSLIAAYKVAPTTGSPYYLAHSALMNNVYTAKFMRSHRGSDLLGFNIHQILIDYPPDANHFPQPAELVTFLRFLVTLAVYRQTYKWNFLDLSDDLVTELRKWLVTTRRRASFCKGHQDRNDNDLREVFDRPTDFYEFKLSRRHAFEQYAQKHEVKVTQRREHQKEDCPRIKRDVSEPRIDEQ